uniref:Uncharacterized protein n=1 Tax=Haptolina brevifila TaxID=156173 RepID=A0A7S2IJJ0_9EUKA|mmetsp:Transcript_66967/g.132728  ORF Transcript_66967/g.132728 Transcript_66967/m.132728 type:complete len:388 (+) Transcript_66967:72-1235(+)|eukprot:CAMPEP_0174725894 /NCGR_PEP_ID=MMETSP1094-20130205/46624_1 /TAXON_ID=156173 /ORGANISM="Chrysochromulina brevifilum, Strain UTEX LB 985" /LENGTH=387 /DNA_ID=CAMNT_0015927379 /DNA_START=70 /DNA_END=1233 /DNA_ORIENTATION=+
MPSKEEKLLAKVREKVGHEPTEAEIEKYKAKKAAKRARAAAREAEEAAAAPTAEPSPAEPPAESAPPAKKAKKAKPPAAAPPAALAAAAPAAAATAATATTAAVPAAKPVSVPAAESAAVAAVAAPAVKPRKKSNKQNAEPPPQPLQPPASARDAGLYGSDTLAKSLLVSTRATVDAVAVLKSINEEMLSAEEFKKVWDMHHAQAEQLLDDDSRPPGISDDTWANLKKELGVILAHSLRSSDEVIANAALTDKKRKRAEALKQGKKTPTPRAPKAPKIPKTPKSPMKPAVLKSAMIKMKNFNWEVFDAAQTGKGFLNVDELKQLAYHKKVLDSKTDMKMNKMNLVKLLCQNASFKQERDNALSSEVLTAEEEEADGEEEEEDSDDDE